MSMDRNVVVIGASSGIGEACALSLDRLGYTVFAGVRKTEDAERLLQNRSQRLKPIMIDVTDKIQINKAFDVVSEAVGANGIQGLVNSAGISLGGPLEFMPIEAIREQFDVNVFGLLSVVQAFLPLIRTGDGRIVMIGSANGKSAIPLTGAYSAAEFAIEAVADTLRVELSPFNIHVSLIIPGIVKTNIWEKSLARADELERNIPDYGIQLYKDLFQQVRTLIQKRSSIGKDPDVVARAVMHALTAKVPRTRYFTDFDAWVRMVGSRLLPDRIIDGIIIRLLKSYE